MRIHREDPNSLSRSVVKNVGVNESILATTKRFPLFFKNRDFVVQAVWTRWLDGSYLYCWESYSGSLLSNAYRSSNSIRAESTGFIKIVPLQESNRCKFTIVQKLDSKGSIPSWVRYQLRSLERHQSFGRV